MKSYYWRPRSDITPFELACLQVFLNRNLNSSPEGALGGEEIADQVEELSSDCQRHVVVEEHNLSDEDDQC